MRQYTHLTDKKIHFVLIGESGLTHFWKSLTDNDCMIAFHTRTTIEDAHKSVDKCWLTDAPCRHEFDKSGTDAQDRWLPLFEECNKNGDFSQLYGLLEKEHMTKWPEESSASSEVDVVSA